MNTCYISSFLSKQSIVLYVTNGQLKTRKNRYSIVCQTFPCQYFLSSPIERQLNPSTYVHLQHYNPNVHLTKTKAFISIIYLMIHIKLTNSQSHETGLILVLFSFAKEDFKCFVRIAPLGGGMWGCGGFRVQVNGADKLIPFTSSKRCLFHAGI